MHSEVEGPNHRAENGDALRRFDAALQWDETLREGTRVLIRPICKEDAALERAFVEGLSPESRYYRFMGPFKLSEEMLKRFTQIDFERDMALIALVADGGQLKEIGVSRFCLGKGGDSCECAVAVSDAWQGKGLGTLLLHHLIDVARRRGIQRMVSISLYGNLPMHALAESLGFRRMLDGYASGEAVHVLNLQPVSGAQQAKDGGGSD